MEERKLKLTQALFPFGPGAIWNNNKQSFIATDFSTWEFRKVIEEKRLQKHFGVHEFHSPPPVDKKNPRVSVPFSRFPRWHFCSENQCRRMHYVDWKMETGERPQCPYCSRGKLTPMRFVVACENGHLGELQWSKWVHSSESDCEHRDKLSFRVKAGGSGGLESLIVKCIACNSQTDVQTIFSVFKSNVDQGKWKCNGTHPWTINNPEECNAQLIKILQRGASNLRFDFSTDALSIPPESNYDRWKKEAMAIRAHRKFPAVLDDFPNPQVLFIVDGIAAELSVPIKAVEEVIEATQAEQRMPVDLEAQEEPLEPAEYDALKAPDREHFYLDNFQKENQNWTNGLSEGTEALGDSITHLSICNRLRVLRILEGFGRITKSWSKMVHVDLHKDGQPRNVNALPAVQSYGEGIFFDVNEEKINAWANKAEVQERVATIRARFQHSSTLTSDSFQKNRTFTPSAKFMLLHTLSHLLIQRMEFVAGYPASSIREKIYCDYPGEDDITMNGILLYTAEGDAVSSLGGLAALGRAERFSVLLAEALIGSERCSYDPVCIESPGQGREGLNRAACHACALLPETSCGYLNLFLDRALLAGSRTEPQLGFFADVIAGLDQAS
jgi:hypothetical protein